MPQVKKQTRSTRPLMRKRAPKVTFSFNLPEKENNLKEDENEKLETTNQARGAVSTRSHHKHKISKDSEKPKSSPKKYTTGSQELKDAVDSKVPEAKDTPLRSNQSKPDSQIMMKKFLSPSNQSQRNRSDLLSDNLKEVSASFVRKINQMATNLSHSPRLGGQNQSQNINRSNVSLGNLKKIDDKTPQKHKNLAVQQLPNSHSAEPDDHSMSSASTMTRNLESRNNSEKNLSEKDIRLIHHKEAARKNLSFDFELTKKKVSNIQRKSVLKPTVTNQISSGSSLDELETPLPPKIKTFILPEEVLQRVKPKKREVVYQVERSTSLKPVNPFTAPRVKRPRIAQDAQSVPEDWEILFWQPHRVKRTITDVTSLEVALTVIFRIFRDVKKKISDPTLLSFMRRYEELITKDITAMVSNVFHLKNKQKEVRKLEKEIKHLSDNIGKFMEAAMLERGRKAATRV